LTCVHQLDTLVFSYWELPSRSEEAKMQVLETKTLKRNNEVCVMSINKIGNSYTITRDSEVVALNQCLMTLAANFDAAVKVLTDNNFKVGA